MASYSRALMFGTTDSWRKSSSRVKLLDGLEAHAFEELQKLLHVRHPNVTHIYDAFEFKGAYYLISERCDQTLSDLMSATWFDGRSWI